MKILNKWMCSSGHLKLFGVVARMGLVLWIFLPAPLILAPWYFWADGNGYSTNVFGFGAAVLAIPIAFVGLTGFRRKNLVQSRAVLQVELRPGVLGLHIGKEVPKTADLLSSAVEAVQLARKLGLKAVRIESPLLVKGRRHGRLVTGIQQALIANGLVQVQVQVITPRPMLWVRSFAFTVVRILRRYRGKHLPKLSWFRTTSAGILLVL